MSTDELDTIIVGARCAGAPLAVQLARAGQKVLLLDAAKLPSDQPVSTHFVQPLGMGWLDELGVGAEVRRLSPASFVARAELDGATADVRFAHGRSGHCLRRLHLDRLLQDAAVQAGADLRDQTKVTGLVRERDRVVGVEAVCNGSSQIYRARIVVGADGRNSTIAEHAGAKEYLGYDGPRFLHWAYWPVTRAWREHPALSPFDAYIGLGGDRMGRLIFPTDSDLLLIGVAPCLSELPAWKGQQQAAYLAALQASPTTAPLVEGNQREGRLYGLLKARFFFREAAGPGFALVGDAGLHKDPTPGIGITDALRDARNLAAAILKDSDASLVRYWRQRDVDSIDLFHFAKQLGDPDFVNPFNRLMYDRGGRSPELLGRMAASQDRDISPFAVFPTQDVMGWVLGAALRGRFSVVRSFLASGRLNMAAQRARAERVALLEQLPS